MRNFGLRRSSLKTIGVTLIDIVPRRGPGDDILLSEDRNPNTNGAKLLGVTTEPGVRLPEIVEAVKSGRVRALIALGEDPSDIGITAAELSALPAFVAMGILSNVATQNATVILPAFAFAENAAR